MLDVEVEVVDVVQSATARQVTSKEGLRPPKQNEHGKYARAGAAGAAVIVIPLQVTLSTWSLTVLSSAQSAVQLSAPPHGLAT